MKAGLRKPCVIGIFISIIFIASCLYISKDLLVVWPTSLQPCTVQHSSEKSETSTPKPQDEGVRTESHNSSSIRVAPHTSCQVRKNVFFLKTHKTGSTTMQNILLRYAWVNDLTVGLPSSSNNFIGYAQKKKFHKSMMQPIAGGRPVNMIMHHMIFDYDQVSVVLPKDTIYFTFLRDPSTQFESVFKYFKTVVAPFMKVKSLEEFLENPKKYFDHASGSVYSWFAKNGMAFDLGFDNLNENDDKIRGITKKLDEIFDLVLIAEYFDTSLVLLKEKLCWSMKDVAYLSVNARQSSTVQKLSKDLTEKIKQWNKIDSYLYSYYNKTFWQRVSKYGKQRLKKDLEELNKIKSELKYYCVEDGVVSNKYIKDPKYKMYNPPGVDVTQYRLKESARTNETCVNLILPEIPWWRKMLQRQKALSRR